MQIDRDEEHRGAVGVDRADQPAVVHIAHDVLLDAAEGAGGAGIVVHRQRDAGDDLDAQAEGQDAAEGVPVVEVPGRREAHQIRAEADDRQAGVEPALDPGLRLVGGLGWLMDSADFYFGGTQETHSRERRGSSARGLSGCAGGVVDRAVARAEPAAVLALGEGRHAAEVGAAGQQDQPLLVAGLHAGGVLLPDPSAGRCRRPWPRRFPWACGGG